MSTMKICNQCEKHTPPDSYGLSPKGWYTVNRRQDLQQLDFCSAKCLEEFALGEHDRVRSGQEKSVA